MNSISPNSPVITYATHRQGHRLTLCTAHLESNRVRITQIQDARGGRECDACRAERGEEMHGLVISTVRSE